MISRTERPLMWFAGAYVPRLCVCVALAVYIFFIPSMLGKAYFYPVLVVLLCLNEGFNCLLLSARVGFYARVSEPRIAGTYMTLLGTMSNIGQRVSSTLVLYIANWLPKSHAYSIEVAACCLLGCIWIIVTWPVMRRLSSRPIGEWHLQPSPSSSTETIPEAAEDEIIGSTRGKSTEHSVYMVDI
jgi:Acetyl-coenzyme A transporter 1